jgi:GDPmannose 4,6-dehydratase
MQWLMLQQDHPEDFVIATGVQYSVRQFVEFAAPSWAWACVSKARAWMKSASSPGRGRPGQSQAGYGHRPGRPALLPPDRSRDPAGRPEQSPRKTRLDADHQPARTGQEMVLADYNSARRDALVKLAGFKTFDHNE